MLDETQRQDNLVSLGLATWRLPSALRVRQVLSLDTLATAVPGKQQVRFAAILCAVIGAASLALLPWIARPMPPMPSFLTVNQTALVLVYGLMTLLFSAQYRRTRALSLLVLGSGSLFTTVIVAAQLICFPNMVVPGLLLGQGPATLTWLWNAWHMGPPIFALPYAIISWNGRLPLTPPAKVNVTFWVSNALALLAAGLIVIAAVAYVEYLPNVTDPGGGYWALTTSGIGPALIVLNLVALAALCWTTRLHSVLQLWLGVSLCMLLFDNVVTDMGAARATMGWLIGRLQALLAGLVILGVYLRELDLLYFKAEKTAFAREDARVEAEVARENLEIALEASGMGDWELDLETEVSYRTLRHDRIFGYTTLQEHWGRRQMLEHVHPHDRTEVEDAFVQAGIDGRLELECRIVRADDRSVRWIAVHGRTNFDAAGRARSIAGCIVDVTDRRQADERRRQTERLEAAGQLTAGVAHDFNNLLTVMMGALEMIASRPDDAARVERLARSASGAGRRGRELTNQMLSFSRRQITQPEIVNLNRLIGSSQVLVEQAVGRTIKMQLDLDPQLNPVRIDPGQFQGAFLHLIENARNAMPTGGMVRLETRNIVLAAREALAISHGHAGEFTRLTVSDTGIGMDDVTVARAFEPFFTTKEIGKGAGLGLSQVYGFARQAGGFCHIRTAPGQGCAIQMYLPRSVEATITGGLPLVPLRRAVHGEVVLIVEDEDTARELAAESIQSLGYRIMTAPDARVALDILRGPTRVDILFSDIVMPGGMNGTQLAVEARRIRSHIKVLLTSGYAEPVTEGSQPWAHGMPLLPKPYLKEDLASRLRLVTDT